MSGTRTAARGTRRPLVVTETPETGTPGRLRQGAELPAPGPAGAGSGTVPTAGFQSDVHGAGLACSSLATSPAAPAESTEELSERAVQLPSGGAKDRFAATANGSVPSATPVRNQAPGGPKGDRGAHPDGVENGAPSSFIPLRVVAAAAHSTQALVECYLNGEFELLGLDDARREFFQRDFGLLIPFGVARYGWAGHAWQGPVLSRILPVG
jgi:hypothetical protein